MKCTITAAAALAALLLALPAAAQTAPPTQAEAKPEAKTDSTTAAAYAGKWTVDVQSPQGAMQLALEVKIDAANKVTGTLNGPNGPQPIAGEFKDGVLGFGISFDAGGQMLEIWFESALKDDKLAGTMYLGEMGNFPWTATRAKEQ